MPELDEKTVQLILQNYVPKRYLSQTEAVRYTGTSHTTIKKWVGMGLKQIIFEEESRPKYDIKDIDAFMAKFKI